MILVRDVFRVKFGKMREALAVWKQMDAMFAAAPGRAIQHRILTDLVGPYYTLVLESTFESLAEWENFGKAAMSDEWRKKYQEAAALTESGYREIFNIVS